MDIRQTTAQHAAPKASGTWRSASRAGYVQDVVCSIEPAAAHYDLPLQPHATRHEKRRAVAPHATCHCLPCKYDNLLFQCKHLMVRVSCS